MDAVTNIIYGKVRGADGPTDDNASQHNRKRRAVNIDPEEEGAVDKDHKGGTAGINAGNVLTTPRGYDTHRYSFSHTRLLSTFGYQYSIVDSTVTDANGQTYYYVTTPYARVPCHGIPFYMTQAEFKYLPVGAEVKRCTVDIECLGFRLPFVTNSADVKTVNGQQAVHGLFAYGLCNKYGGLNMVYETSATDFNTVTGVSFSNTEDCGEYTFWGKRMTADKSLPKYEDIGSCFGREVPLVTYYTLRQPKSKDWEFLDLSFEDVQLFNMNTTQTSSPNIHWEYRPQVCVLKPWPMRPGAATNSSTETAQILYGFKTSQSYYMKYLKTKSAYGKGISISSTDFNTATRSGVDQNAAFVTAGYDSFYNTYIEHCGSQTHGIHEYAGGLQPPTLHIGCMPVNTWFVDPASGAAAAINCTWLCRTNIELECSQQIIDPLVGFGTPNQMVTTNINDITIGQYPLFFNGYKGVNTVTESTGKTSVSVKA